jgi:hypothetical protein
MLKAIGILVTADLGQLPAVFPFRRAEETSQLGHRTGTHFRAGKHRPNATFNLGPIHTPCLDIQ